MKIKVEGIKNVQGPDTALCFVRSFHKKAIVQAGKTLVNVNALETKKGTFDVLCVV